MHLRRFCTVGITMLFVSFAHPATLSYAQQSNPACTNKPIELRAKDFTLSVGIEVGRVPQWGLTSIHNAEPYTPRLNTAAYQFDGCAGAYHLDVEYAAAESRPVEIYLNGDLVIPTGLAAVTGGWSDSNQTWQRQGDVQLISGANTLRFLRESYFPHIRAIRLIPY